VLLNIEGKPPGSGVFRTRVTPGYVALPRSLHMLLVRKTPSNLSRGSLGLIAGSRGSRRGSSGKSYLTLLGGDGAAVATNDPTPMYGRPLLSVAEGVTFVATKSSQ